MLFVVEISEFVLTPSHGRYARQPSHKSIGKHAVVSDSRGFRLSFSCSHCCYSCSSVEDDTDTRVRHREHFSHPTTVMKISFDGLMTLVLWLDEKS